MSYAAIIDRCRKIMRSSPEFPVQLGRLPVKEQPAFLYAAGDIPSLPAFAIVGTRSPDAHGITLARKLARECSLRNIPVVSGGALGIDSAAHMSCIESGGKTVVVLAAGIENPHPPCNTGLFVKAVESGGCLVTDQHPSVPTQRFLFLQRNRLIAALSGCVIIVQARYRSGALSTASWARACGAALYAVAGSPLNPLYSGTNRLISEGRAKIIVSADAFFNEMPAPFHGEAACGKKTKSTPGAASGLNEREKRVIRMAGTEPLSIDEIAVSLEAEVEEISQIIFNLEMKGFLCASDPGRYIAAPEALSGKERLTPDEK